MVFLFILFLYSKLIIFLVEGGRGGRGFIRRVDRMPSVDVQGSWEAIEEFDLSKLTKLAAQPPKVISLFHEVSNVPSTLIALFFIVLHSFFLPPPCGTIFFFPIT